MVLNDNIRSRGWCFTWHLGQTTWEAKFRILATITCDYLVWQEEKGSRTEARHIQGYVYFRSANTMRQLKKKLPGARLEKAIGTAPQNKEYCTKARTRLVGGKTDERGAMPAQGARTDITDMMIDIGLGLGNMEMFEKYPTGWAQYSRILKEYRFDLFPARNWMTKTHVYFGKTGTGKSRRAHFEAGPGAGCMIVPVKDQKFWADGCVGCENVIMEDYRGEIPYAMLLRLLDRYPLVVEIKGSTIKWAPKNVYITSNVSPVMWYPKIDWEGSPLQRRLKDHGVVIQHIHEWKPPLPPAHLPEDVELPPGGGYAQDSGADTDLELDIPETPEFEGLITEVRAVRALAQSFIDDEAEE